jgi:hypothetical protein
MEIPLCGEGFTSQTNLHATCHDVATNVSPFVTNINHTRLSTFLTKQHHFAKGAKFGKD